jgi:tripartite-type tricarboxylate transporter receptor subunit TctC
MPIFARTTWCRLALKVSVVANLTVAVMLSFAAAAQSSSQKPVGTYPERPIRFVVPFAAGGATDVVARLIAPNLSAALGQTVIVENRPGAATVIGTALVAQSAPDGYTILQGSASLAITPSTMAKLPYNVTRDLIPVIQTSSQSYLVLVRQSSPIKSLQELLSYTQQQPRKISYGTPGHGSSGHLSIEQFCLEASIQMTHVAYKGDNPALTDLLGGHIDLVFATISAAYPHLRSGQLRALAITAPQRSTRFPDLPTVSEAGVPGYEASSWNGVLVPAGTPQAIVERLEQDVAKVLKSPELVQWYTDNGADPGAQSSAQFKEVIRVHLEKWARLVKTLGLTPE